MLYFCQAFRTPHSQTKQKCPLIPMNLKHTCLTPRPWGSLWQSMMRRPRWIRWSLRTVVVGSYIVHITAHNSSHVFKPTGFTKMATRWLYCFGRCCEILKTRQISVQFNFSFICPDEPADYKNRGDLESDMGVRKACRFSRTQLGPCSGLEDRDFGFREGKPCVIVKLNRIVNFRPRVNVISFRVVLLVPDVVILCSWPADLVDLSSLSGCPRILSLFTFFVQPPSSNDTIPEEAQHKVQPNVIPIFCTNKVRLCSLNSSLYFCLVFTLSNLIFDSSFRKRRMLAKLGRLSTTVLAAASPCSITRTTASCCTLTTCSLWWPCSSPIWPGTLNCALSAKCLEKTFTTAKRTATRDALTLRSKLTLHDRKQDSSTFPDYPSLCTPRWREGRVSL